MAGGRQGQQWVPPAPTDLPGPRRVCQQICALRLEVFFDQLDLLPVELITPPPGSVELLVPIQPGMSEAIVDLFATGRTLRDNGLSAMKTVHQHGPLTVTRSPAPSIRGSCIDCGADSANPQGGQPCGGGLMASLIRVAALQRLLPYLGLRPFPPAAHPAAADSGWPCPPPFSPCWWVRRSRCWRRGTHPGWLYGSGGPRASVVFVCWCSCCLARLSRRSLRLRDDATVVQRMCISRADPPVVIRNTVSPTPWSSRPLPRPNPCGQACSPGLNPVMSMPAESSAAVRSCWPIWSPCCDRSHTYLYLVEARSGLAAGDSRSPGVLVDSLGCRPLTRKPTTACGRKLSQLNADLQKTSRVWYVGVQMFRPGEHQCPALLRHHRCLQSKAVGARISTTGSMSAFLEWVSPDGAWPWCWLSVRMVYHGGDGVAAPSPPSPVLQRMLIRAPVGGTLHPDPGRSHGRRADRRAPRRTD